MGIIHSQNGWYFLEAWIVLQGFHLLKCPKTELWRLAVVLYILYCALWKRMKNTWRTIWAHGSVAVEQRAVGLRLLTTNRQNICGKVWLRWKNDTNKTARIPYGALIVSSKTSEANVLKLEWCLVYSAETNKDKRCGNGTEWWIQKMQHVYLTGTAMDNTRLP